jgi:hypothetical protein
MIDQRLQNLSLERNHLSATLIRLDEVIAIYDNKIQQRMNIHIEDAAFIANSIPDNHPQAQESKQRILDATDQFKAKKISSLEYFRSVMDAAKPYAVNIPVLAVRLNRFEDSFRKTILIEEKREALSQTRLQVQERIAKIDDESKLLQELKGDLNNKINQINVNNPPEDERKSVKSSTGQIGFLLANKSQPDVSPPPILDFKEILEKAAVFIMPLSEIENEKKDVLASELSSFDLDFDLDEIAELPELLPIKSYEQSAEDKPYDPNNDDKPSPPAYDPHDLQQDEEKQPEENSPDHFRPGR